MITVQHHKTNKNLSFLLFFEAYNAIRIKCRYDIKNLLYSKKLPFPKKCEGDVSIKISLKKQYIPNTIQIVFMHIEVLFFSLIYFRAPNVSTKNTTLNIPT